MHRPLIQANGGTLFLEDEKLLATGGIDPDYEFKLTVAPALAGYDLLVPYDDETFEDSVCMVLVGS